MVCFSSRDLAGIFEPIEALAASLKVMAVSLPYRPLDASERRFVSLVRCAPATYLAPGNSESNA